MGLSRVVEAVAVSRRRLVTDSCQTKLSVTRLAWFVEETRNPNLCVSLARCFSVHLFLGDRGINSESSPAT